MELHQLRSFVRVADEGSITRAAEGLYLTQPAVTQQIQGLERELGMALFDRTGRGMRLTGAGALLHGYARRILALAEECRQALADARSGSAGRLVLGAGVTTSIFHLPGWLRSFREGHPGIDVVVRTGRSREVAALALEREIDLGLVTSAVEHPDLRVVPLFEEEILLVTPPGHPLAGRAVPPEELSHAPLILFPQGSGFREYLDRALADAGIDADVKMEMDSAEAIKSLVAVGLGISFLPAPAVEAEVASGALARTRVEGLPPLHRSTSLLYRADRTLGAGARAFRQSLYDRYGVRPAG